MTTFQQLDMFALAAALDVETRFHATLTPQRIIAARESRQGQRTDFTSVKDFTEVQKPSDKAAEMLGVSKPTAIHAKQVVDAIDNLKHAGDTAGVSTPETPATRVQPQHDGIACPLCKGHMTGNVCDKCGMAVDL